MSTSTTDEELSSRIKHHEVKAFDALAEANNWSLGEGEHSRQNKTAYSTLALANFAAIEYLERQRLALVHKELFS